jgi:hypothetical protein
MHYQYHRCKYSLSSLEGITKDERWLSRYGGMGWEEQINSDVSCSMW